jgi:AbrB family looped-hinge helix DNA binding protein
MKTSKNTVTLSSKHHVVVPAEIREMLGISPGEKVTWSVVDGAVQVIPYRPASSYRGIARGLTNSDIPNDSHA